MQQILLTGGKGVLGKHICTHFKEKYQVHAPFRQELELRDSKAVENYFSQKEITYILNAAHVGVTRNSTKLEDACLLENLTAFRNIFQNTKHKQFKRFIHFGSGAEYAKPFHKSQMKEEDAGTILPQDVYGLSKFFIGQLLERQTRGQFINLRLFGIFGPYEDYRLRFISNAIVRSLLNLPIIVQQNSIFDYVYINDFLKILNYFMQNPAPEISYNISAGTPMELIEIAKIVHELTNNKYALIVKNYTIKENYTGNNSRLINFLPKSFQFTPITIAITQLIHWYKENLPQLNVSEILEQN